MYMYKYYDKWYEISCKYMYCCLLINMYMYPVNFDMGR